MVNLGNPEFEKVIQTISTDINKTLVSNLGVYFKTIDDNNKVVDLLKPILLGLPEYTKLKGEYDVIVLKYTNLKNEYDNLKSSNVKNITIDITETPKKSSEETVIVEHAEIEKVVVENKIINPSDNVGLDDSDEYGSDEYESDEYGTDEKEEVLLVHKIVVKPNEPLEPDTEEGEEEEEEEGEEGEEGEEKTE